MEEALEEFLGAQQSLQSIQRLYRCFIIEFSGWFPTLHAQHLQFQMSQQRNFLGCQLQPHPRPERGWRLTQFLVILAASQVLQDFGTLNTKNEKMKKENLRRITFVASNNLVQFQKASNKLSISKDRQLAVGTASIKPCNSYAKYLAKALDKTVRGPPDIEFHYLHGTALFGSLFW